MLLGKGKGPGTPAIGASSVVNWVLHSSGHAISLSLLSPSLWSLYSLTQGALILLEAVSAMNASQLGWS